MNSVTVVIGGQFGSEAKGQVNGMLTKYHDYDWAVSNSGSQAGHTYIDDELAHRKFVTRHLPIAGVVNDDTNIYIGPAAVIDLDVLMEECFRFHCERRVYIHRSAMVIMPEHKLHEEAMVGRMGSTGKGNGAALASKIMREDPLIGGYRTNFNIVSDPPWRDGDAIIIEAAQGFDLSVDRPFYPYCTSRNCWVGQALADAWIHPSTIELKTVLVVRTFPIRVGGNSGGWYPDQRETTWEEIGVEPEVTTVTGRVRRVATFSEVQFMEACIVNRPNVIAVSHLDYFKEPERRVEFMDRLRFITKRIGLDPDWIYGHGPTAADWTF
jgi:adenylosuccinate synthase